MVTDVKQSMSRKLIVFTCLPTTSPTTDTMHIKARVLRDIKRRNAVQATEVVRRAYLYVARNQTLPPQIRHQAQLQLNAFPKDTRPATVKNRCTESGRGRGVMSEFGLCRVSTLMFVRHPGRKLMNFLVPIPPESDERRTPWCPESQLVNDIVGFYSVAFSFVKT